MRAPLRLALIWHFHQPEYVDPATGAPSMPWTRLHALKDYADMAAHVERHPGIRATFNIVPTLVAQIEALASGEGKPDRFLELARTPAAALTEEERTFVIGHFFSLNRPTMAAGLRRLNELWDLRGNAHASEIPPAIVARFDDSALRDLQVLFHLAWSGPTLSSDPLVTRIRAKGRGFTEDDKNALLDRQQEFLGTVIPLWRRLHAEGRIELSVTPYYHPILPLLCDFASAHEALPGLDLPGVSFRHPEDADLQLAMALDGFAGTFGRRPEGGWPSEGAISEAALHRMGLAGWKWAASDEDVLFASLGEDAPADREAAERRRAETLYRPWRHGSGPVLLFRDHDLSDRIGFRYASRPAADAAGDFVGRLNYLRGLLPDDDTAYVVSVILDGENAWEHYPDNGVPFFDALYGAIAAEPGLSTVTASEAAAGAPPRDLPRVAAGSWIYRNLATWIGHEEKNRAWELLAAARDAVLRARGAPDAHDPAWRALLSAEGSDWFWWFGDDHHTEYAAEFDAAFRDKLRAAYEEAGADVPDRVREPLRRARALPHVRPTGAVRADLDGRVTDYFEWQAAGRVEAVYGAMQSSARLVRQLLFGSDGTTLFLRVDPFERGALDGTTLTVRIAEKPELTLSARSGEDAGALRTRLDRILEAAIPLDRLGGPQEPVRFAVEIEREDGAHQRVPADGFAELPPPDADPARFDWAV